MFLAIIIMTRPTSDNNQALIFVTTYRQLYMSIAKNLS